ncbi:MAG TPA: zf-TFIIB domain-containing protein [Spirochaetota bacterium]|nr:zf-TFIIB domain-containing protein [Spirochaetota bacterium]
MNCPVCSIALTMSERQGVEIDFCSKCRGVWLDRGELDKIIERASSEMAPPLRQASQEERREHHHKRKKSFLHEIFD